MAEAKNGDKVKVNYTGKLDDGTVFDSSEGKDPLEFTLGDGQIIPGFEKAILGLNPGDSKEVTIPCAEAYGERRDDMVVTLDKSKFPPDIDPKVGEQLQIPQKEGDPVIVTVTEVSDASVVVDANHPLAGKDLIFDITLVSIG